MTAEARFVTEPIIAPIGQMALMPKGIREMVDWVRSRAPACVPDEARIPDAIGVGLDDHVVMRSLFPHDLTDGAGRNLSHNELLIELAGRGCYNSYGLKAGRKSNREYIEHTQQGVVPHRSIEYHAKMSFFIAGVSRRVSHELIRNYVGADRTEEGAPCLAADTLVYGYRNSDTQTHYWTIRELFEKQQTARGRAALSNTRFRSADEHGRIVRNKIDRVVESGVKPVFSITTLSGRQIKATGCHRFMIKGGWKELRDLNVGDRLVANGLPAWANKEWIEDKYIVERMTRVEVSRLAGVSDSLLGKVIRRLGIKKPLRLRKNQRPGHGVKGMHTVAGRKRLSEMKLGAKNPQWRGSAVSRKGAGLRVKRLIRSGIVSKDACWGCLTKHKVEVHHLDHDWLNNAPGNLVPLCAKCHRAFHFEGSITVFSDQIISIETAGVEPTYDIVMKGEPHNFVANGLVVHNSQQSTRYVENAGFYVVPPKYLQPGQEHARADFQRMCEGNFSDYRSMIHADIAGHVSEHGEKPRGMPYKRILEAASGTLIHSIETSFVWTTNPSALAKLFLERDNEAADLEFQRFARKWKRLCMEHWPNAFPQAHMREGL